MEAGNGLCNGLHTVSKEMGNVATMLMDNCGLYNSRLL